MPIVPADIIPRLTVKTGAAGDTTVGTPIGSLGGFTSTTPCGTNVNDLFDDVSGAENAASESEYRAVDILNNHATLTALSSVVWLTGDVVGGATASIGVDPVGPVAKGAAAQGTSVVNEDTAPAGVVFTAPTTILTGLALGDIAPGQVRRVWIKRSTANTSALNADGTTLQITFNTAA